MKITAKTDVGRVREINEDYFFVSQGPVGVFDCLLIVCDGMGGREYGEVASKTCADAIVEYLKDAPMDMPVYLLDQAISEANLRVHQKADELNAEGMGTTLVLAGFIGNHVYCMNIGDSRLYLLNQYSFTIKQVTKDHSYVEEMVEKGLMVRNSEAYLKQKNIITRAVGAYAEVQADSFEFDTEEGDVLLLCTDGLTNMLKNIVIKNLALDETFTSERRVDSLIYEANVAGGRDNITVILCECEDEND